jgi:hypothetical protein
VQASEEVPRLSPDGFKDASQLRFQSEAEFLMATERNFYLQMAEYLKKELGVKCPVIANSDHDHSKNGLALLSMTSLMDAVDGHEYWQHPSSGVDKKTGKNVLMIENSPMVNHPERSTVVHVSRSAVEGKPFIVSEFNHPSPNEFSCEGYPIFTAYALLQDWDGIFFYTFEHVPADMWNTNYALGNSGAFDMGLDPVKMAEVAANALMFLRGDLKTAESCVFRGYTNEDGIEGLREVSKDEPFFTKGFSPLIPLIEKTRIQSFEKKNDGFPAIENPNEIKAKTGEISWQVGDKSFVEVAAPKTESLIGFIPDKTNLLKHLKVKVQNEFASINLISIDNKPLATAGKLLLVTAGQSGMTGMKFSEDRKWLEVKGSKPTTIEVIKGEIILTGLAGAKSVTIEPLDGAGNPMNKSSVQVKNGKATISIGKEITMWYCLEISR